MLQGRDLRIDFAPESRHPVTEAEPSLKLFFQRFEGSEDDLREGLDEFKDDVVEVFFRASYPCPHRPVITILIESY